MELALIISQTIFYSIVSLAIIAMAILFSIIAYHLARLSKELEAITSDIRNFTDDTQKRISDIIERLSELPILSFFLKSRKKRKAVKKLAKFPI